MNVTTFQLYATAAFTSQDFFILHTHQFVIQFHLQVLGPFVKWQKVAINFTFVYLSVRKELSSH
jgi:hypothetical protein